MSEFWDAVNKEVDSLFGKKDDQLGSPFPSETQLDQGFSSPLSADPTVIGSALSPDSQKDALSQVGYSQPNRVSPYEVDQAQQFGSIIDRPSPFTVIDVTPGLDGGTRLAGQNGQLVNANNQPANQNTLDAIGRMLGMPIFSLFRNAKLLTNASRPGVTYQVAVSGNSLRVDRLSGGLISAPATGISISPNPLNQPVTTPLIPNDAYVQNALTMVLSGIFVQFDSPDNPVFLVKPGETYDVVFTTLFITTFGSAGRFRVIAGNKAKVSGNTDERVLRQNLHIWDGGGLLDNPMYHPVPFSTRSVTSPNSTSFKIISSNYDSGANLTQQASGNIIGSVANKGYAILWITGVTWSLDATNIGSIFITLFKAKGNPATLTEANYGNRIVGSVFFQDSAINRNAAPMYGKFPYTLAVPIRVVLAGFDQFDPANPGSFESGESLIMRVASNSINITGDMTVSGYSLGFQASNFQGTSITPSLIPFNPFPQDVTLPV